MVFKIKIIGVTGKMASGKTTVSRFLSDILKGAKLLDLDKIAKEIYCNDLNILKEIKECFGNKVFYTDVKINYNCLGSIVFASKSEMKKLNKIMFPAIEKKVFELIDLNKNEKYIIIDAAILFDTSLYKLCDFIILVKSNQKLRKTLLEKKCSNLTNQEIQMRLKGQKIKICKEFVNFVVKNNGSEKDLYEKTLKLAEKIK